MPATLRWPALRAAFLSCLMLLAATAVIAASATSATTAKRLIRETDLFHFVWVADPQLSPDGRRVAFVRVSVNAKKDGYDTAIWVAPADGSEPPRPFTSGLHDNAPRWSPSGRLLAFTRTEGTGSRPQIFLLDTVGGGEAQALTDLPGGATSPAWSPDGRTLAFASGTSPADLEKKKAGKKADEEYESDVRVITTATYRSNDAGYRDRSHPSHLWTVAVPTDPAAQRPEAHPVTSGTLEERNPVWSKDGAFLYYSANRLPEPDYTPQDSDLYAVPVQGGKTLKVADIDGPIEGFTPSPDGKRIAFLGALHGGTVRSSDQPDLFVVDLASGAAPRNLTAGYDFDLGEDLSGDQAAPRGALPLRPVWSRDGGSLYEVATDHGRANLQRIDAATGKVTPLTSGDQAIVGYSATPDGSRLAVILSTPTVVGDLWVLDPASGKKVQITRFNDALFSELDLTPPEEVTYKSFDGRQIQAWVQKPPGFDPAKKYPLILDIHGGPHTAYGWIFDHEFQWMAAQGYVVLYPNPRGSTSYGQEFANIIQYHYPGDDYKDLMAGVDELLKRGSIDPARLGVTGGSGGGILTNWIITQTDRFAAAVAQRSIADWADFWYTADFTLFTPRWFKAPPFENPAEYSARSPITFISRVKTPLMLIEGEADYRTPPAAGGEQMFRALKYLKKPVVMVRFPDETHELSRSGKPWHRVERLRHIVGWFDQYLQGKPQAIYEAPKAAAEP